MRRYFYLDVLLTGADAIHEAEALCEAAKSKMTEPGMLSWKWGTNDLALQDIFERKEPPIITKGRKAAMSRKTAVLGMNGAWI